MSSARTTLIALVAIVVVFASSADAQFSPEQRKCRETISKNGEKLADTIAKTLVKCHKKRAANKGVAASVDCNLIAEADTKDKVDKIAAKLIDQAVVKCQGMSPADVSYDDCPAPCDAAVPSLTTFEDVGECLVCLIEGSGQDMSLNVQGDPDPVDLNRDESKCHAGLGKNQRKHFKTLLKERRKCQKEAELSGETTTTMCAGAPNEKISKARTKGEEKNVKTCDEPEVNLGELGSCSDFNLSSLNACVFNDSESRGESIFQWVYRLSAIISTTTTVAGTTTTSTTTTVMGGSQDPLCPDSGELLLFAGVRQTVCSTNTDCIVDGELVGTCDTILGQCVTDTDLDTGYNGLAHNADINDEVLTRGLLQCPGPFDGLSSEPCGECQILGFDPSTGLCRCNTANRTTCDDTFELDFDDCAVVGAPSCSTNADCSVCRFDPSRSCTTDKQCSECAVSGDPCDTAGDCKECSVSGGSCVDASECPSGEACNPTGEQCLIRVYGNCLTGPQLPTCSGGACVGRCDCTFGPPLPLSAGNTPACAVNNFAEDVSGTSNVDLGAADISASLSTLVFTGELVTAPCPFCTGDTTANDGVRDGTCVLGMNEGESCDTQSANLTFPAPSGDGYSLDCYPELGKNISGNGLSIAFESTTGAAVMEANVECGYPPFATEMCPCSHCSSNNAITCTSNADCVAAGAGTCATGILGVPRANLCDSGDCAVLESACTGDGTVSCTTNTDCAGAGGICVPTEAECATGPSTTFCDGATRANGEPYVSCITNADCDGTECGSGVGAGLCGVCTESRKNNCFAYPLAVIGQADPETPVGAAAFCIPQTGNMGIDTVTGLPGPARAKNVTRGRTFCSSDPGTEYIPGVGGCP